MSLGTIKDSRASTYSVHEPSEMHLPRLGISSFYEIMARDNNASASSDFFRPIDLGFILIRTGGTGYLQGEYSKKKSN